MCGMPDGPCGCLGFVPKRVGAPLRKPQFCLFCKKEIEVEGLEYRIKTHKAEGLRCPGSGWQATAMARDAEFINKLRQLREKKDVDRG